MDGSIERIAAYAVRLDYSALTANVVHEAKRRLIDTLGCGLAAFDAEPSRIARKLASRVSTRNGSRILGTEHRTLPELATFANAVMMRYIEGNDAAPGGGGHPSDVIAPLLAIAEATRSDGKALITAITLAYEVYYAVFRSGPSVRDRGIDHVFYATVASAVGAGKLLGLDAIEMGHAIALAVTPSIPLHATRRGDLSMWKGVAAGNAARNGVFAALLAAEGMTGPPNAIEGSHGLAELLGQFKLGPLAEAGTNDFQVTQSSFKYFLSEYHSQNPITLALQLSREVKADDIETVTIHTYWFTWHEIGSEPEKWHPTTRESADHSLPFMISAVLIDGAFSDEIFSEARIQDPQIHALADKVSVREDPEFTKRFPAELPCRIDVRSRSGEVRSASASFHRGHPKNPMTDDEVGSKFSTLGGRFLPRAQLEAGLQLLWNIDEVPDVGRVLDAFSRT